MGKYGEVGVINFKIEEPSAVYDVNRDFTSLEAWQCAHDVKLFFYRKVLPKLPAKEKYNLDIQIRKASVSATANISEGYGRFHYQESIQFYRMARGSLYELKDHLISCHDLGCIPKELYDEGIDLIESAKRTLNGYINFVKKQVQGKE